MGHLNIWGCPDIQGASKHIGSIQTYRGNQTYGGEKTWGASKRAGTYKHRGHMNTPKSDNPPMPTTKVGKHFMI